MTLDTWKIAGLVIAAFASVVAILGALYGIVTKPMLRTVTAEISASESRIAARITEMEKNLKLEITEIKLDLKLEMAAMEKRLNERIDTRLVHR